MQCFEAKRLIAEQAFDMDETDEIDEIRAEDCQRQKN